MKDATQTKWIIDKIHSNITFKVKHLMIAYTKGSFKIFDANFHTIGKDFTTAEIDLWIDASSISTGDLKRDEHLMGEDFFDVKNHKQITFVSRMMGQADSKGNHELKGELTLKGISKQVLLNVEFGGIVLDASGNEKTGFTVTGKIKRSDWGLIWNVTIEAGGVAVSDEISICCDIELINSGQKDLLLK